MKCQEAQQCIHDYADQFEAGRQGQMSEPPMDPARLALLKAHFKNCAQCSEKLDQELQLRKMLRLLNKSAPVPPPSTGFVDRALWTAVSKNNAVQQNATQQNATHEDAGQKKVVHRESHRQGFIKGFGAALVAGLALWTVVTVLLPSDKQPLSRPSTGPVNNTIAISLLKSTNVNLAFNSLKDVRNATITIRLSDNLELVGYNNRQILQWKTDLVAGDNVLTLPIKALKPQQGKIIAQISHNKLHKSLELILDVKTDTDPSKPGISKNYKISAPVA